MRIVIDATNLREGGGITHLVNILKFADLDAQGFSEVLVLGCKATLARIEDKPKITKVHLPVFEMNYAIRVLWLIFRLKKVLGDLQAQLLFAPGGSFFTKFHPAVTMSRNSLPLELREARRYGFSMQYIKLLLLRIVQQRSFRQADGFIFLTGYARANFVKLGWLKENERKANTLIIPHGVDPIAADYAYTARTTDKLTSNLPFRIIYVSIIDVYKHQGNVAEAVRKLNEEGLYVEINFVGPFYKPAYQRFMKVVDAMPAAVKKRIRYHGRLERKNQYELYREMDLFLFASSCENMPNILLEGMSSGLPITSSDRGPMPEILKDCGVYFDPESVYSISEAIRKMYNSPELRSTFSKRSFELSKSYSWCKCAQDTFAFLRQFK